jgi:TonB family protein
MEVSSNSPLIKSFTAALFLHLLFFAVMFTVFPDIKSKVIKPASLALDFVQETIQGKKDDQLPQKEVLPTKKQVIPVKKELKKNPLPVKKMPAKIKEEIFQPQEHVIVPEETRWEEPQPLQEKKYVPETGIKKADQKKEMNNFLAEILMRIEKAKYYPSVARKRGMTGIITCKFSIFQDGSVKDISLVKSSKYKLLNKAAVEAIKKGAPYPDFPSSFKKNIFISHVDIKFYLN